MRARSAARAGGFDGFLTSCPARWHQKPGKCTLFRASPDVNTVAVTNLQQRRTSSGGASGHHLVAAASGAVMSGRGRWCGQVHIGRLIRVIDVAFSFIDPGWAPGSGPPRAEGGRARGSPSRPSAAARRSPGTARPPA